MTTTVSFNPNDTDPEIVSTSPLNYTDFYEMSSANSSLNGTWDYNNEPPHFTELTEYKAAEFINTYYLYLVCAIGVPGNVACIVTLAFMKPKLSSALYMMTLAVADLLAIALKLSYLLLTKYDVRLGDRVCQLVFMFGNASQTYSNWILVAMTTERFIAIWFPFQVKKFCTKRNAVSVIVILFVFFTLANIQYIFTFEEDYDSFLSWNCRPKKKYNKFIQVVWYWIDGAMYAMIPIIVIFILNSLIIYSVRKSSNAQLELTHRIQNLNEKMSQQKQITMMLLTTSVTFLVLVLPNSVFFIAREYWTWSETQLGIAQYYLMYQIVFLLSDLNHAVNFYLYCLSGRKFRQKFIDLICCRKDVSRKSPSSYVSTVHVPRVTSHSSAANNGSSHRVSFVTSSPIKSFCHTERSKCEDQSMI